MEELFQKALGIESPWFVKSIEFEAANKRLDIHVDFKRGATFSDFRQNVYIVLWSMSGEIKNTTTTGKNWTLYLSHTPH